MNRINPRKLLNSKWTAVQPRRKEKHFVVTKVEFDENGGVELCLIEAVYSRRATLIDWHSLKNTDNWITGWK